ncbi:PPE family protein [Mycobacterium conspicuum]|jgi:PPE-repeat protein|uniref:PPE family protein PPE43 n=1 Tax=Mycobacterium conspicuum TaxID=44010 RepID=A0A1X1THC9_9MYCO|nr:PPE family protein [Mycobacterium conspicuum]ORV43920.1 hypothetical protein AWC00_09575 [Mycobacterium conspicuum]BBZ38149.1 PPE family protein PPE43 [Mycobacterium conspicuum]
MDFGALPPEINSGRIYAGPGAGPMMAAATAWNGLAAELSSMAAGYESVITELTCEQWLGPASAAMAAAAQPYVSWMNATAALAQRAATQAMASAAAFEAAFAAMVPPPVIAANRAQLAALVATNFLGINTPAIMATEAHYAEMWAQDAAAMYAYAASSASAGTLTPMTPPAPTANPAGLATQAGLMQTIASLPNAVAALASPLAAAAPILSNTFVANAINGAVDATAWWVMNTIPNSVLLGHAMNSAAATPAALAGAHGVAGIAFPANLVGAPVSAALGQAPTVGGGLSVPATWSAATPAVGSEAALAGSGWTPAREAAEEAGLPALAPVAAVGGAARSLAFGGPRYGIKPTVMPRSVFG